jgi:hypothetical protein
VPFQNLCGKDITAPVDFLDPTNERTWDNCLERCVNKAPLCYGFDFTPLGAAQFNCWLMNASFPASAAAAQSYVVDAVMLGSAFLDSLGAECRTLGLAGCWRSKGTLGEGVQVSSTGTLRAASATGAGTTSGAISSIGTISTTAVGTSASSLATAAPSAPPAPASSVGLSIAAKAGIGGGAAIAMLLLIVTAIFSLFKRRKRNNVRETTLSSTPEKLPVAALPHSGTTELQAQRGMYADAELQGSTTYPHLHSPHGTQQVFDGRAELAGPNKAPTVDDLRGTYGYGELAGGAERHELYGYGLRK